MSSKTIKGYNEDADQSVILENKCVYLCIPDSLQGKDDLVQIFREIRYNGERISKESNDIEYSSINYFRSPSSLLIKCSSLKLPYCKMSGNKRKRSSSPPSTRYVFHSSRTPRKIDIVGDDIRRVSSTWNTSSCCKMYKRSPTFLTLQNNGHLNRCSLKLQPSKLLQNNRKRSPSPPSRKFIWNSSNSSRRNNEKVGDGIGQVCLIQNTSS